jgi:hypothetical protein
MVYVLTYIAACSTLLITFGIAKLVGPSEFQAVALGLLAGGFGAVLANLGSDQSQFNAMLRAKTRSQRVETALRNLGRRIAVLTGLAVLFTAYAEVSTRAPAVPVTFFIWAAALGIAPNGYVDYVGGQAHQQVIAVTERFGALLAAGALVMMSTDRGPPFVLATAVILVTARLVSLLAQWRAVLARDTEGAKSGIPDLQNSGTALPTFAAMCNSFTAYVPALLLDYVGRKSDLALYSLTMQALSVVILRRAAWRTIWAQASSSALSPRLAAFLQSPHQLHSGQLF